MKRLLGSVLVVSSVFFGLSSLTLAESPDATATTDRWWEQVAPLFPHTSGSRWTYALSGKQYAHGGELQVEVKGTQHVPHLKQDALLIDESHASGIPGADPEVMPVLYYAREGYLVRDTAHIYSNPQRTSLMSTGNLGEAVVPILPLWRQVEGTDWKPVDEEHWGRAARLAIAYHVHPEKREMVTVKAGEYRDCVPVEGTVNRGDGSGYRYQEWYAPGVGLVKATTTDLQSGEVLVHKELVSFRSGLTKEHTNASLDR
jgi:hypothetical protein